MPASRFRPFGKRRRRKPRKPGIIPDPKLRTGAIEFACLEYFATPFATFIFQGDVAYSEDVAIVGLWGDLKRARCNLDRAGKFCANLARAVNLIAENMEIERVATSFGMWRFRWPGSYACENALNSKNGIGVITPGRGDFFCSDNAADIRGGVFGRSYLTMRIALSSRFRPKRGTELPQMPNEQNQCETRRATIKTKRNPTTCTNGTTAINRTTDAREPKPTPIANLH